MDRTVIIAICLLILLFILCRYVHTTNRGKALLEYLQSKEFLNAAKIVILFVEFAMKDFSGPEKLEAACKELMAYIPAHIVKYLDPELIAQGIQMVFDRIKEKQGGHTVPIDKDI